jgi:hypothetical protein
MPRWTQTEDERFWAKVRKTETCWLWTASGHRLGYGHFYSSSKGGDVQAHRWSYEALRGDIPEGLDLDHLCRNPACVNPDHLEPVTRMVNLQRGKRCRATHCKHGHPFPPRTVLPNGGQRRKCLVCRSSWHRAMCDGIATTRNIADRKPKNPIPPTCKRGHPYDAANTLVDTRGSVHCRSCARERGREKLGSTRTYKGRYMTQSPEKLVKIFSEAS